MVYRYSILDISSTVSQPRSKVQVYFTALVMVARCIPMSPSSHINLFLLCVSPNSDLTSLIPWIQVGRLIPSLQLHSMYTSGKWEDLFLPYSFIPWIQVGSGKTYSFPTASFHVYKWEVGRLIPSLQLHSMDTSGKTYSFPTASSVTFDIRGR